MKQRIQTLALILAAATALLTGCAAVTPTREITSGYAIFDIKANPDITHGRIAEAVKVGLQKHMGRVQITNSIPPSPLPEKAPRFQMVSPFKGTNLAAPARASGQRLEVPTCDGAIMTANADDTSMRKYGESTTFFACLMPYQGGWSLNIYTTFEKASGSFSAATLGATLARTVVGDTSQFIPRAIAGMIDEVKAAGAAAKLVEAYP
jgi:hypothetical protein